MFYKAKLIIERKRKYDWHKIIFFFFINKSFSYFYAAVYFVNNDVNDTVT